MKLSVCSKNNSKNEAGFILLEMILVIVISALLTVVFIDIIYGLYQKNSYFNFKNAWQLDAYLVVDFIADQVKNSTKVEIINQNELDLYSFYDEEFKWLKFCSYKSKKIKCLSRRIGSEDLNFKDFSKNLAILDNIDSIKFKKLKNNLLKIQLTVKHNKKSLIISRLVKI